MTPYSLVRNYIEISRTKLRSLSYVILSHVGKKTVTDLAG